MHINTHDTGLIYYGVGEPIYHLSYNRFVAKGTMTYNEISQEAMNLCYYHWGVCMYIIYFHTYVHVLSFACIPMHACIHTNKQ